MNIERNKQLYRHNDYDCINYNLLNGNEWSLLLAIQPQFSIHCDWSKLSSYEWRWLLTMQPKFAELCDWDKLNGRDWYWLLHKQPQLEKYRK